MSKNKHICVILSGCGFLDGAEVHEAVCTLLYISKKGSTYEVVAPDKTNIMLSIIIMEKRVRRREMFVLKLLELLVDR